MDNDRLTSGQLARRWSVSITRIRQFDGDLRPLRNSLGQRVYRIEDVLAFEKDRELRACLKAAQRAERKRAQPDNQGDSEPRETDADPEGEQ